MEYLKYLQPKLVYICHPFTGDPEGNVKKVKGFIEDIGKGSVDILSASSNKNDPNMRYNYENLPVAVSAFTSFPESMCEPHITRQEAMSLCIALLARCDEIWIYSRNVSDGMVDEINYASENDIKIVWKV